MCLPIEAFDADQITRPGPRQPPARGEKPSPPPVSVALAIRSRRLRVAGKTWSSRSDAPFRMLSLLWLRATEDDASPWVSLGEIARAIGVTTHGRQMARILDFIEQSGARLVDYQTRTRGPYRLACPPGQVSLDMSPEILREYLGLSGKHRAPAGLNLAPNETDELLSMLRAILDTDSLIHDGSLEQAARAIDGAPSRPDSPWAGSALYRRAFVALRLGHFEAFRELLSLQRENQRKTSIPDPLADITLQLLAIKAQYDKGHLEEAERMLAALNVSHLQDRWLLGRYFNMRGLVSFRRWRLGLPGDDGEDGWHRHQDVLREIVANYNQALCLETAVCDYHGVQATSFNLANALLTPFLLGMKVKPGFLRLEQGLAALGLCAQTCTKFSVGMDSIWAHILFLEVALASGREFAELNRLAGGIMGNMKSLDEAFQHELEIAEQLDNPAEIEAVRKLWRQYREGPLRT